MGVEQSCYIGVIVIGVLCFIRACMKKKVDIFLSYVLNTISGIAGIYFINSMMTWMQLQSSVGINGVTILSSTVLGIPGLLMIYGISFLGGK